MNNNKLNKRRIISSYISVVVSISMVLFLFGLLSFTIVNIKNVSTNFKESLTMSIYLKDEAKAVDLNQIKNSLVTSVFVKDLNYISKEEAVSIMKTEFGEDFINELGYNPLINSFDINLVSEYVEDRKIDSISNLLREKNNFIEDIQYDRDLVSMMNTNLKKITMWMFPVTFLLIVISVLIINSSIKLALYSNRWTIKTMQLVAVFEAKKEDEGGNAEERWNDNANTASVMNPECKYHTFAIGKGVRKKWIRRQKKSYVEYNKRGLLDSRWTLEEKGISYEDIKEIMINTLNEILKKSHKPPVYPKEPQTLNEFM